MSGSEINKRSRLGSRKSHNGCITCKIRRVKCDETRPVCRRCTTTGRICDGYQSESSGVLTQYTKELASCHRQPNVYGSLDQAELQMFEFFMNQVVPGCTRFVDEQFWHIVLPQACLADPVVRNAVMAMTSLIRYPQYCNSRVNGSNRIFAVQDEHHHQALRWYGRSIAGLSDMMKKSTRISSTTLIACVLYICIECLEDNILGLEVLFERTLSLLSATSSMAGSSTGEMDVQHTIRALLNHMSITHGRPTFWNQPVASVLGYTSQSLSELRESMYELIVETHAFIAEVEETKLGQEKLWQPPREWQQQFQELGTKFDLMKTAIDSAHCLTGTSACVADTERYHMLMLAWHHYFIWLAAALSMFETAYDDFFDLFRAINFHARQIIAGPTPGPKAAFSFETRVIPSLFFVAIRCRHPIICREAVSLLRDGPEIENVWKAVPMASLAERKIGIEESGEMEGVYYARPRITKAPAEEQRIYQLYIVGAAHVPPSWSTDTRQLMRFRRWQKNVAGEWINSVGTVEL